MKPAARIILDGRDISTELFGANGVLVSLVITDEEGVKSDTLELTLDNRESFKAPPKGAPVQVWLGYEPAPTYMGRFTVDEWGKGGPVRTLTVSAKAAELTTSIRAAKVRSFADKTVGAIVQQVAGDNGLSAVIDSSLSGIAIKHIDQQSESDVAFLSRLARRVGASFKLADGKVLFSKKGSTSLPGGGDKPVVELTPRMVGDWLATNQARGNYKSVTCYWQDHEKGKRTGVTVGSGSPQHRDRRTYATAAEARTAAAAQLGELNRGKMLFDSTGPGLPVVFAGAILQAKDFDPDVDGDYLIKTVVHSVDGDGGYSTSINAETQGGDTEAASE